jgi:hypothetical protein
MKKNEYDSAEVLELGTAETVILGRKTIFPDEDSTLMDPIDKYYDPFGFTAE